MPWCCVLLLSEAVALSFTACSDTHSVSWSWKSGVTFLLWLLQILSCVPLLGKAVLGLGELLVCRAVFVLCPEQCLFQVLHRQNGALRRELHRLRLQLQDSRAEPGLPAAGNLLSARTKLPLHPSVHGRVGRLLLPELLLPVLVLGGKKEKMGGEEEGDGGEEDFST